MLPAHISISGTYWSGSSVLVDIFSENSDCSVIPDEFSLFSYGQLFYELNNAVGGSLNTRVLTSLLHSLRSFGSSEPFYVYKVCRYLCHSLNIYPPLLFRRRTGINSLLGSHFQECTNELSAFIKHILLTESCPSREQLSILAAAIMHSVARSPISHPTSHLIYDQLISPFYLEDALVFLPHIKVICVDRDYRDQYVSLRRVINRLLRVNSSLLTSPCHDSYPLAYTPSDFIKFFVDLRLRVDSLKSFHQENYPEAILWVNFEDLMVSTRESAETIFDFVGLNKNSWQPFTRFNPNPAKLGQWQNSKYLEEINIVSDQLHLHNAV